MRAVVIALGLVVGLVLVTCGGEDDGRGPSTACCKHCGSDSQPCGDTCIALDKTCRTSDGCACF